MIQGCAHLMKTAVELAFYSGTLTFLCTWLDLSRGSPVSEGSLAILQASASVLVFTAWFLYFLDGKVRLMFRVGRPICRKILLCCSM